MHKRAATAWMLAILGVAALLLWWLFGDDSTSTEAAKPAAAASMSGAMQSSAASSLIGAAAGSSISSSGAPLSPEGQRLREEKLVQARERYERASQVFSSYRDATRYPHESRPIADAPDQVRPFDPVIEEKTMRNERGEGVKGITLKTGQDRVFLSGQDTVKFTVQAIDSSGKVLPLLITRAAAQSMPDGKQLQQVRAANLDFTDAGASGAGGADDVAGDGNFSARLSPSTQGFAGFAGTIRVLVFVRADGKEGVAHFDVIYTEDAPATWGTVREAQEQGSLNFYVKANVRVPGRYVVSARVDDARGQPFALVTFNDEVAAGAKEFKLHLFGALIRDKRPVFPLKLRDVDGFLLIPDKFPDRLMMSRRAGVVHTSGSYNADSFSPNEWSSEERDRYLAEYGRDLDAARRELERLGGK
ncbi:hypothetical protein [Variovorax sp. PCZ-1]|uniref:hypothetical protein n=1 Tax=Variovorax sp. PCZ-1 TaxID=2835533 RepID=UPI001BD0D960|nr:hypothetical protein [Variovorax sp. PCZ-1]MBS7808916.1 hypothetical protein [Variovorax sp. PCZ-1]